MADQDEQIRWVKSTWSASGNCAEICRWPNEILFRNSRDPDGAVLAFDIATFERFLHGVRRGDFDLL
jgi:Domain of unknown function (DUF397)